MAGSVLDCLGRRCDVTYYAERIRDAMIERRNEAIRELKIPSNFCDGLSGDRLCLSSIAMNERVLAKDVHHARNAMGMTVDSLERLRQKSQFRMASARTTEAVVYVSKRFLARKRQNSRANSNALIKLSKLRELKSLLDLGLAGENDLQQPFARRLEIHEQADFLENFGREALRFIDEKNGNTARAIALGEPAIESDELIAFGARRTGHLEIRQNEINEIGGIQS